jgi:tetratricopeptide (TPR) repeat protein
MAQMQVFVSHSHEDDAFCRQLVAALRQAGADVWYDAHKLDSGQLLDTTLRELRVRPVFVLILSEAALRSQRVRNETTWAVMQLRREPERIVLPVLARAVKERAIWRFLRDVTRVEAPGGHPFAADEAVCHMLHLLALTAPEAEPIAPAPPPSEGAEHLVTMGKVLLAQGDHIRALAYFEQATQRDAQSWEAWYLVGCTLIKLKRRPEALSILERAIALNAGSAASWNTKGNALRDLRRDAEALAAYEQALALDPRLAMARVGKKDALYELKHAAKALAAYEQALALHPTKAVMWTSKAVALNSLGRHEDGLAAAEQAVLLDPRNAWAWGRKADALGALGRTEEADQVKAQAKALESSVGV